MTLNFKFALAELLDWIEEETQKEGKSRRVNGLSEKECTYHFQLHSAQLSNFAENKSGVKDKLRSQEPH